MKNLIISILLLSGLLVYGQDIIVPKLVLDAFEVQFPNAEEVSWKQFSENYQAEFIDEYKTLAIYKVSGKWLKTVTLIPEEELPETVFDYIDENYETYAIKQAHFIVNNNKVVSYKVVLEDLDEEEVVLKFNGDGELIE